MKAIKIMLLAIMCMPLQLIAKTTDTTGKAYFYAAKRELENMLSGKKQLSYEEAIYQVENAWYDGKLDYTLFDNTINSQIATIQSIANAKRTPQHFTSDLLKRVDQKQADYDKALLNASIFSYITDTAFIVKDGKYKYYMHQVPFTYSYTDPLGTSNWQNTQVVNLLNTKKGNCFSLASLFKIFSEKLNTDAILCTAPEHIYIRHADDKGVFYNIELSSRSFPGAGTLETITYTPNEAAKSGVALRELDLKQSIALCLVYLAKGYEYKTGNKDYDLMMSCAETALKYDDHNLNAMLLKAELMEDKIVAEQKTVQQLQYQTDFKQYQDWITHIYSLGYREMPYEMKNILIKGWSKDTLIHLATTDHTPQSSNKKITPTRYASLSWGLFDEEIKTKLLERYNNTVFDTKKLKIVAFLQSDVLYNQYSFDPVVFAWNVDPMAHKLPGWSPYAFCKDNPIMNFDPDGAFPYSVHVRSFAPFETFGGGFEGDGSNRGYTTALGKGEGGSVTSREQHAFTVNPTARSFSAGNAWSDKSSHPLLGTATAKTHANISGFKASTDRDGNSVVSFTANMAAANPLVKGSPDIDVHTQFALTENEKQGTLKIHVVQTGDRFPAAETFIGDSKGNQLFIGVSPADGNPYTSLPGDNSRSMMTSDFNVQTDKDGVFTGVQQGDKTYSPSQWNSMMQSQPTTK